MKSIEVDRKASGAGTGAIHIVIAGRHRVNGDNFVHQAQVHAL